MLYKTVYIVASGGGSQAISNILTAGGASEFFAGAEMPYSTKATLDVVGGELWDSKLVSERAAHQMAAAAFTKARKCGGNPIGIGMSAALCKVEKERKGRVNQAYLAVVTSAVHAYTIHIVFKEHEKSRAFQEAVCAMRIQEAVMRDNTEHELSTAMAHHKMSRYWACDSINHSVYEQARVVPIMPGSFNPMHAAHKEMFAYIWSKFEVPPILDIGMMHKFKSNISPFEFELRQNAILKSCYTNPDAICFSPSWTPLMVDKHYLYQEMFPEQEIVLVMGADTYEKIDDDDRNAIKAVVFPREGFKNPEHPRAVVHSCTPINISSTELRNGIQQ